MTGQLGGQHRHEVLRLQPRCPRLEDSVTEEEHPVTTPERAVSDRALGVGDHPDEWTGRSELGAHPVADDERRVVTAGRQCDLSTVVGVGGEVDHSARRGEEGVGTLGQDHLVQARQDGRRVIEERAGGTDRAACDRPEHRGLDAVPADVSQEHAVAVRTPPVGAVEVSTDRVGHAHRVVAGGDADAIVARHLRREEHRLHVVECLGEPATVVHLVRDVGEDGDGVQSRLEMEGDRVDRQPAHREVAHTDAHDVAHHGVRAGEDAHGRVGLAGIVGAIEVDRLPTRVE